MTTNISLIIFTETKTMLTPVWNHKGPRRAKVTPRKENRLTASPSLTSTYIRYLKAPQDVWNCVRNRHRFQRAQK